MKNRQVLIGLLVIAIVALARLSDSIPNFAPIGALALFSGAVMRDKRLSFVLPIGAIFLSDVVLEFMQRGGGFYPGMVFDYIAYGLVVLIGFALRKRVSILGVVGASLVSSGVFFLVSNLGVWISGSLGYPHTMSGLMTCYEMALPFVRNTFISDLVFSGVFFGGYYALVTRRETAAA